MFGTAFFGLDVRAGAVGPVESIAKDTIGARVPRASMPWTKFW